MIVAALILFTAASADLAQPMNVKVGQTLEIDVGRAMGFRCDDASLLIAGMKTVSPQSNHFVITGVREGETLCRIGIAPRQPNLLVRVHVSAAK